MTELPATKPKYHEILIILCAINSFQKSHSIVVYILGVSIRTRIRFTRVTCVTRLSTYNK